MATPILRLVLSRQREQTLQSNGTALLPLAIIVNLLLPKSTVAKLLIILMLIGSATACHAKSTRESGPLNEQTFFTPLRQSAQPGDEIGELFHQGRQRTYYLHTPKSYQPNHSIPLVLAFHGYGSQGSSLALSTGFNDLAEQKGFIVVYPNGIERRWDVMSNALIGVDDVSFVSALIDQLTKIRAIDKRRIYATGVSNGGFLVQRLACEPKSQIAAFASVVATLPGELQPFCHPETPIDLLMINGTGDRKVPWEGGSPPKVPYGWILSVPDTINFWQQHDGCTAPAQIKQLPGNRIEISRYPNCRDGSEVELVTMKGVGHVWPRGGSGPNHLLNGSKEIWDFFQRHFRRMSP